MFLGNNILAFFGFETRIFVFLIRYFYFYLTVECQQCEREVPAWCDKINDHDNKLLKAEKATNKQPEQ